MLRNLFKTKISLMHLPCVNIARQPMSKDCTSSPGELLRHNFHKDCEEGLNQQINNELFASYTYLYMANCLGHPDTALFGYSKFFSQLSKEEQEHAKKLVDFVNMRGGRVQLFDVKKPEAKCQGAEDALEKSIILEQTVLQNLEELHKIAMSHNDFVLTDYLESNFLKEQYKGLQQLAEMLTNVKRAGDGEGLIMLDMDLMKRIPHIH